MIFLNNSTDQNMIAYFAKSMPFMDLCKAVGMIPIKKLVYQKGKKPFINTYYVSPEEVSHLKLKNGDNVHHVEIPKHPNTPEEKIKQTVVVNDSNLIDSGTKIEGSFSDTDENIIKTYINDVGQRLLYKFSNVYEDAEKHIEKNLFVGTSEAQLKQLDSLPKHLKLEPHIEHFDADNEKITISWKTNVPYTEKLSSSYLISILKGEAENYKSEEVIKNPDGTATITLMLDTSELTKKEKLKIQNQVLNSYVNKVLSDIEKSNYKFVPRTDKEKEFNLEGSTSKQAYTFRTLGICADVKDTKANEYLNSLFSEYLYSKSALKDVIAKKVKNSSGKDVHYGIKSFSEIRDTLKQYSLSVDNFTNSSIEDNKIKCRISSVSDEVQKAISQRVLDDWDNEIHKSFKPVIKGVYEVKNLEVDEAFNKAVEWGESDGEEFFLGKNCVKDEFYHGTGAVATSLILGHSGRFKIGDAKVGRMFGRGIYLADKSSKSAQYLDDESYHFREMNVRGTLMICEAVLGNCAEIHNKEEFDDLFFNRWDFDEDDYDEDGDIDINNEDHPIYSNYTSLAVEGGKESSMVLNNEFCVFDEEWVRPKYLIDMEIVETEE